MREPEDHHILRVDLIFNVTMGYNRYNDRLKSFEEYFVPLICDFAEGFAATDRENSCTMAAYI